MKRSSRFIALAAWAASALSTTPALAQSSSEDAAGAALGIGILACYGVLFLVLMAFFIWWIILVIDLFKREEYEFPGSTGSSKTLWIVIMLVGWAVGFLWVVTPVYYFMVYKKGPKPGTGMKPSAPSGYAPSPAPAAPSAYPPPPSAPMAPPAAPPAPPAAPVAPEPYMTPPAPPAPPAAPADPAESEVPEA
ncbi:MAG: hypothetical protein KJ747_00305 [Actinobacteria bacterium]|nr:hypothetical protein [Actinomycetota bacterium]MCG2807485.1 hypothetical protein [Coriobacteriia bacterium]